MKRKILIIICLFSCSSCKKNQSYQKNIYTPVEIFTFSKNDINNLGTHKLSEIYSKISGFPLDITGGPIGHVSKTLIFEDNLFVFDSHYAKKLFVYDLKNNGKYKFFIGNKGKGPGEFIKMSDFAVDPLDRQILTVDYPQRKLSWFDLEGNYIRSKTLEFLPIKIHCDSTYIYLQKEVGHDENAIIVFDKKLNPIARHLPFSIYPYGVIFDTGFLEVDGKLLINLPHCDTIFQLNRVEKSPYLAIKSDKYSFYSCVKFNNIRNKKDLNNLFNAYRYRPDPLYKDIIFPNIYFEDKKLKLFDFSFNQREYSFIKNKLNNTPPGLGYLSNDFFLSYITFASYDNKYGTIGFISTESMISADIKMAKEKEHLISKELMYYILNPDPNLNPFIVFLK